MNMTKTVGAQRVKDSTHVKAEGNGITQLTHPGDNRGDAIEAVVSCAAMQPGSIVRH